MKTFQKFPKRFKKKDTFRKSSFHRKIYEHISILVVQTNYKKKLYTFY